MARKRDGKSVMLFHIEALPLKLPHQSFLLLWLAILNRSTYQIHNFLSLSLQMHSIKKYELKMACSCNLTAPAISG